MYNMNVSPGADSSTISYRNLNRRDLLYYRQSRASEAASAGLLICLWSALILGGLRALEAHRAGNMEEVAVYVLAGVVILCCSAIVAHLNLRSLETQRLLCFLFKEKVETVDSPILSSMKKIADSTVFLGSKNGNGNGHANSNGNGAKKTTAELLEEIACVTQTISKEVEAEKKVEQAKAREEWIEKKNRIRSVRLGPNGVQERSNGHAAQG